MKYVLDRISAEGPLQARDFEAPKAKRSGPWFDWKPAKIALELLFHEGKLMIRERKGFQKIYDLSERVIPSWVDLTEPTREELLKYWIKKAVEAHGLVTLEEISYLRKKEVKTEIHQTINEMKELSELIAVKVEDQVDDVLFTTPGALKKVSKKGKKTNAESPKVKILSPFDNSVIQRKRLKRLFDFDYQIECYVPEPKRKFGYFCLPLLFGNEFIGRVDSKADRKTGQLLVHHLALESRFAQLDGVVQPLAQALQSFAAMNNCPKVVLGQVSGLKSMSTQAFRKELSRELKA